MIGYPAINVRIVDVRTNAPVAAGATIIAAGPSLNDSITFSTDSLSNARIYSGGFEKAGIYDVTVRKVGYQDWTRTGIVVTNTSGDCNHVKTVSLTAALVPIP